MLPSCKNKTTIEMEHVFKEWVGKNIKFPNLEPIIYSVKTKDISKYAITKDKAYKVLLYIDSTGCTSCKLRLSLWISLIEDLRSKVDFLFYFNLKSEEEVLFILKQDMFVYPIYIDKNDELNKLNNFPSSIHHQCFLLDKDNKVLAIGNPVHNFQIWDLYKQIIIGEISNNPPITTVEAEQTEIESENLQIGKTSESVFVLKNTGTKPLIIRRVDASCGCTVPEWDKQPVAAGNSTEIKVKITPEKSEYFNKTVTVYCNTEKGRILFIVKGTVE
jgi:hypothetical protein